MTITAAGRCGIGTGTPSAPLSVSGTVSNTFNAGSQLYAIGSSTAYTTSQLGPVTVSVAATFGGPIQCSSIYCTSDRRCKENIELLDTTYCDKFYDLDVYTYKYRGSDETIPKIGFIRAQMNIDYSKITAINFMMIKKLLKRIEQLESKL
ncbi:uncharacterized protein PITG_01633 [Phytophthora infestans T30-4]|uniref:Peptidase S74 domain-containing protein n=1 Tax=Phytophthora infestans (strain T30-4) TaxID=403677 RepID=D0MTP7_PHYIT|nr:uncharacterized protein PITG_01633 [Phytophthora infestans T30-4]EEY61344.1 hypothetical protein PITG_01633 [Phytophthora infestans T30-4]|eukprot:XP_002908261.1 hypothetical protein PITG_01633 [Phytophthora infestans T30-4]